MGRGSDLMGTMMCMKLLGNDSSDMDLGKMFLLQQMSDGEPLQISDVVKSKIISKLNLDADNDDLPLDKLMLLQMLNNSDELDMTQLIQMKMLGKMFEEDSSKKE